MTDEDYVYMMEVIEAPKHLQYLKTNSSNIEWLQEKTARALFDHLIRCGCTGILWKISRHSAFRELVCGWHVPNETGWKTIPNPQGVTYGDRRR